MIFISISSSHCRLLRPQHWPLEPGGGVPCGPVGARLLLPQRARVQGRPPSGGVQPDQLPTLTCPSGGVQSVLSLSLRCVFIACCTEYILYSRRDIQLRELTGSHIMSTAERADCSAEMSSLEQFRSHFLSPTPMSGLILRRILETGLATVCHLGRLLADAGPQKHYRYKYFKD